MERVPYVMNASRLVDEVDRYYKGDSEEKTIVLEVKDEFVKECAREVGREIASEIGREVGREIAAEVSAYAGSSCVAMI